MQLERIEDRVLSDRVINGNKCAKGNNAKCRSFDNSPTVLLIFKRIMSMWLFQESL